VTTKRHRFHLATAASAAAVALYTLWPTDLLLLAASTTFALAWFFLVELAAGGPR
jgi:hypothetical protein